MKKVYFDHNATTPVHPEVRDAMLPYLGERFGNPSSVHWAGRDVSSVIEDARVKAASLINAEPSEIVFTGGGSEGDNLAIRGVLMNLIGKGGHVITTSVEHPAVFRTCRIMERFGFETSFLPVDGKGMIDPDAVKKAIRGNTVLISIMYANNETGNLFPVKEIGVIAREHGILFHTDAVQALGKVPLDVKELGVDLLTGSGHKFNAPKGIGIQFIRKDTDLFPQITGGHQESGMRAGTENIAGIAALGKAFAIAGREMDHKIRRIGALRDRLEKGILERVPETVINGDPARRIYNTANISFKFIEGEALLTLLDMKGIALSTGSACSSGSSEPSRVLTAMGLDPLYSRGALRFSLGHGNTEEDVAYCLDVLPPIALRILGMSPFYKS